MIKPVSTDPYQISMTPALWDEAVTLKSVEDAADQVNVVRCWLRGQSVNKIKRCRSSQYGSSAVEKLAAYLGITADAAYACGRIQAKWTLDKLKAIHTEITSNGGRFDYSHCRALCDCGARQKVQRQLVIAMSKRRLSTESVTRLAAQLMNKDYPQHAVPPKKKKKRNQDNVQFVRALNDRFDFEAEGLPEAMFQGLKLANGDLLVLKTNRLGQPSRFALS